MWMWLDSVQKRCLNIVGDLKAPEDSDKPVSYLTEVNLHSQCIPRKNSDCLEELCLFADQVDLSTHCSDARTVNRRLLGYLGQVFLKALVPFIYLLGYLDWFASVKPRLGLAVLRDDPTSAVHKRRTCLQLPTRHGL